MGPVAGPNGTPSDSTPSDGVPTPLMAHPLMAPTSSLCFLFVAKLYEMSKVFSSGTRIWAGKISWFYEDSGTLRIHS